LVGLAITQHQRRTVSAPAAVDFAAAQREALYEFPRSAGR